MESILVWKMSKISKTVQPCSGDLPHRSSQSHAPVASLHRMFSRLSGESKSQSQKGLGKFFKNFGFLDSLQLSLATCSWVEAPTAWYTQKVSQLPLWLPHVWTLQSRKTLRQNFQILSQGFFGNLIWWLIHDSFQSW